MLGIVTFVVRLTHMFVMPTLGVMTFIVGLMHTFVTPMLGIVTFVVRRMHTCVTPMLGIATFIVRLSHMFVTPMLGVVTFTNMYRKWHFLHHNNWLRQQAMVTNDLFHFHHITVISGWKCGFIFSQQIINQ